MDSKQAAGPGVLGALLVALAAFGAEAPGPTDRGAFDEGAPTVSSELLLEGTQVRPGEPFRVGVQFRTAPGWHIYWKNPGDSGLSTEVSWEVDGAVIGPLQWPLPQTFRTADGFIVTHGYEGEVLLFAQAQAAPDADGPLSITAEADVLVCKINCIPASLRMRRTVQVGAASLPDPAAVSAFDAARIQVPRPPADAGFTAHAKLSAAQRTPGEPFEGLLVLRRDDGEPVAQVGEDFFIPERTAGIGRLALVPDPAVPGHFAIRGAWDPDPTDASPTLAGVLRLGTGPYWALALELPLELPQGTAAAQPPPAQGPPSAWLMLLFAFAGGALLNLMPCVFPVLALKAYGLARLSGARPRQLGLHAAAYAFGIVGSLGVLALAVIGLKAMGRGVGWGFQFQEPLFVAAVCGVLVAFALNLFGVFRVGQPGAGLADRLEGASGLSRSAGEGVLTVVLATPCSAPLLGAAVGFALASGPMMTLATFAVLGLGLAAPFTVLVTWPGLARRLPRPGAWMERLKQGLGFALVATAVWLAWVMGGLAGVDGMARLLVFLLVVGLAAWVFGQSQDAPRTRRVLGTLAALSLLVLGGVASLRFEQPDAEGLRPAHPLGARPWSEQAVQEGLARGKPAFVYFTADWCITCKFNERTVLASDAVRAAFAEHQVSVWVGDWTRRDEGIARALAAHGRAGVPLYLVYAPGQDAPRVLPELLTEDLLLQALHSASVPPTTPEKELRR
jgi:thiol:disulfide interchange protein/DsbC/DsbD-like thiol-disulfide interchange protein